MHLNTHVTWLSHVARVPASSPSRVAYSWRDSLCSHVMRTGIVAPVLQWMRMRSSVGDRFGTSWLWIGSCGLLPRSSKRRRGVRHWTTWIQTWTTRVPRPVVHRLGPRRAVTQSTGKRTVVPGSPCAVCAKRLQWAELPVSHKNGGVHIRRRGLSFAA
jgi:hypothetical protein